VLDIDDETSHSYAAIGQELKKRGEPIPSNDLWIAALCRQHALALLGRDPIAMQSVDSNASTGNAREGAKGAIPYPLAGSCAITLPAVELAVKQAALPSRPDLAEARRVSSEWSSSELREEDASRYCPLCSQKLEFRRCKLICNRCG